MEKKNVQIKFQPMVKISIPKKKLIRDLRHLEVVEFEEVTEVRDGIEVSRSAGERQWKVGVIDCCCISSLTR
jgi:hypothetical protein